MAAIIDPDMQEIFEGFLVETQELLDAVSQDLMILEDQPENEDLLNKIFRGFHTIKGTASFMGFDTIATITHHAEDILNKLRKFELHVNQPIVDILLEVHDIIEQLVENLTSDDEESIDIDSAISEINRLKDPNYTPELAPQPEIAEESSHDSAPHESATTTSAGSTALDSVLTNDDLVSKPGDFTEDELDLLDAAFAEVNQQFFDEQPTSTLSKDDIKVFSEAEKQKTEDKPAPQAPKAEPKTDTQPKDKTPEPHKENSPEPAKESKAPAAKKKPASMKAGSETIRIDVSRVESLMDLSGELVLARNRLSQITEQIEQEFEKTKSVRDLRETMAQTDFVTSEIQTAVMRMRMVPVGKLYQKAPRIVRDLSREFGKKIKLVVKGEETEIDRGIIEELNDPLVHMIRNSCDHGIDTPEERQKMGKPPEGTITLDAEQEGNAIVLRISDDGKGMDPEKLKEKALEKGVINEEQAMQMSDREAFQLIFMPGFSTAVKVSAVSGRGVGMDVVRTNIQNLKGMIDIDSKKGVGSTFIIKLPLTLAIIQGLLVRLQNETFAIPLSSVVEVVAIDLRSIKSVNQQEVIRIRKDVNPLLRLDKVLGVKNPIDDLENRYVVVVGLGLKRIGFVVDELLGQQEIVIKSLGEYLGQISAIAGSTILGDGRVIMIVDVADLINNVNPEARMAIKGF